MAAPEGNRNALNNRGGKSVNDRLLAAEVRKMTLNKIKTLFLMPRVDMSASEASLHDALLIKLAGSVLPRLNEVTGEDGSPLVVQMSQAIADKNGIELTTGEPQPLDATNTSAGSNSEGQAPLQSS